MEEKLNKYCTVISGYAFKSQDLSEGTDIPIIKIGNISNGENIIVDNSTQYVNKEFLSVDKKYHVLKGDILISLTGSHMNQPNSMVGRCCRNLDNVVYLLNQRAGKVIPKKTVNKDFLYYVFRLKSIQYAIANRAFGGANQVNVSPKDIMGIKFTIPNFTVQNKISDILTTYDNLIENNNKRIKLLEQMAENLYKEWFVRFRFPGYEDVEFEDGIPKGWKIKRLSDIADIIMGQSPKSENYNTNCEGLPFHQGVGSYSDFYLIDNIYSTKGNRIAEANSIIFSVRAPVGRINITLKKIILGRGVASINSINGYNAFLLWMLKNLFQKEDIIGNGSIFTSVTKKELFGFKILVPHEDLIQKFDFIASGLETEIRKLSLINNNLTKQRDLLLPRLMSGKLEV